MFDDVFFMREALREAQKAKHKDEVPIGCVIELDNNIIARAHNLTETLKDVTAHAEMQAITSAAHYLNSKYLDECRLFVTLEPCIMCAGALRWSRLKQVIFGAFDQKYGFTRFAKSFLHKKTSYQGGIMQDECGKLLSTFFKSKREDFD